MPPVVSDGAYDIFHLNTWLTVITCLFQHKVVELSSHFCVFFCSIVSHFYLYTYFCSTSTAAQFNQTAQAISYVCLVVVGVSVIIISSTSSYCYSQNLTNKEFHALHQRSRETCIKIVQPLHLLHVALAVSSP